MKTFLALALTAGLFFSPAAALAQSFPSKPIHIVVPVPPGGATDALTRVRRGRK